MEDSATRRHDSRSREFVRSNALGLVAIFIALNGTAIAANLASDSESKTKAVKAAKGKAVTAAKRGRRGRIGPAGPAGPAGSPGAPGTALGFAYVNTNTAGAPNTVDEANSKNVVDAQVSHPSNGLWCFRDLGAAPRNAVASSTVVGATVAVSLGDGGGCGAGTQVTAVHTVGGVNSNVGFMIMFN